MRGLWKIVVGLAIAAVSLSATLDSVIVSAGGYAIAAYCAMVAGLLLAGYGLIQAVSRGAVTPEERERRNAKPAMEALVQSMYYVAAADGRITGGEVALVRSVLERELGLKVTDKGVEKHLRDFARHDNTQALGEYLSVMGPEIKEEQKRLVLKYSYLVALSDGELHDKERGAFEKLVDCLKPGAETAQAAVADAKAAREPSARAA